MTQPETKTPEWRVIVRTEVAPETESATLSESVEVVLSRARSVGKWRVGTCINLPNKTVDDVVILDDAELVARGIEPTWPNVRDVALAQAWTYLNTLFEATGKALETLSDTNIEATLDTLSGTAVKKGDETR